MKRLIPLLTAAFLLLLAGCKGAPETEPGFSIACTTYPVYLLANSIAGDTDGVEVTLVINQQVSCLHDYSLTVSDMKVLEGADVVVINGAGLEDFLSDALDGRSVIDCGKDIALLSEDEDDHDRETEHHHHHEEGDPHIWMDPARYAQMARNLADGLSEADPEHGALYLTRGEACARELESFYTEMSEYAAPLQGAELITFHDGFGYFSEAIGMEIAAAIEEEEGAEVSAKALKETISIVQEHQLPAVFTEVNGSTNAARTIQQECSVEVYTLSMIMSGHTGDTISAYKAAIRQNLETITEAYQ
ncbi:MAG: metal ABC transporter substrate-binding protein [Candidatus Onthomonas sp.]|nr:metal ABC transporter substrate-binding protein [Candidatus Onthomonas sp.]